MTEEEVTRAMAGILDQEIDENEDLVFSKLPNNWIIVERFTPGGEDLLESAVIEIKLIDRIDHRKP